MAVQIVVLNTTSPQTPHSKDSEPRRSHRDSPVGSGHVIKAKAQREHTATKHTAETKEKASAEGDEGEGRRGDGLVCAGGRVARVRGGVIYGAYLGGAIRLIALVDAEAPLGAPLATAMLMHMIMRMGHARERAPSPSTAR